MRTSRRLFALLLTICMVLPCFTRLPVKAATASGSCGDNLTWSLDGNMLTISGTGDMYDYSPENPAPWNDCSFTQVICREGVTSIGAYAFYKMSDVSRVACYADMQRIGEMAFAWNYGNDLWIGFIDGNVEIADNAFADRTVVVRTLLNQEIWQDPPTYGGQIIYHIPGSIEIAEGTKKTYAPNEPLKREDFRFEAILSLPLDYTPKSLEIGPYDNSISGQKTVTLTVDGYTLSHNYMVTDGSSHLAQITVDIPNYMVYNGYNRIPLLVYDGEIRLKEGTDYKTAYYNYENVTDSASVTVTGIGRYQGYQKTFTYAIVRRDLSENYLKAETLKYLASPVTPKVEFFYKGDDGVEYDSYDVDYTAYAEQNVNVGQGFVRAVCTGNDYGAPTGNFQIILGSQFSRLPGYYMGQYDGTLDEQTMISEIWLTPGKFTGRVEAEGLNKAYYELYQVIGEELSLVTTYTSNVSIAIGTEFTYDFSSVYNNTPSDFTTYVLSYVWQDEAGGVYSGALFMHIIHQIGTASTMQLEQIANDGDFRHDYLTVYSEDGALEKSTWSISDSSVATVDRGAVTFLKPGTVTVTATCGELSATKTLTANSIDMENVTILDWDEETRTATLMHDYVLLKDGIDFTATAETKNGVIIVTATGKGLFEGTITQYFDAKTGHPTDAPEISTIPGDLNNDALVNNDDVVLLMWHNLFPENYPINVPADLTGDGSVNNDDVVLLMWHNLFPEDYPI